MHKISKPQPFSDFEYLSGNETLFLSEKYLLVVIKMAPNDPSPITSCSPRSFHLNCGRPSKRPILSALKCMQWALWNCLRMTAWRRKRYHEAHNDRLYSKFDATSFGHRASNYLLLVLSVTPFKINQNQNQTSSNDKVQNLEEKEGKYAKIFANIQVTAMFLTQDMRINFLPKSIEILMETPCWRPSGWRSETNRNMFHWVLLQKREFISPGTQKHF